MNLTEPGVLKGLLAKHNLSANKGLGQHFLCSGPIVSKIVEGLAGSASVLEVGPGPGILTGPLSEAFCEVVALEIDERMPTVLAESAPKAKVVLGDVLEVDLRVLLEPMSAPRGFVSNIPYYITGPILTKVAECADLIEGAVLMIQREVAQRILAPAGNSDRGSLSVFLQSHFTISKVCDAPPGAFMPPPKVQSQVLKLVPRALPVEPEEKDRYFRLIRGSFGQPRKTLANNLRAGMSLSKEAVDEALRKVGFDERIRPFQLTEDEWVRLLRAI